MARAWIVAGLAYGDEGKGSWVDHLVRKHNVRQVVRFNGGVQANHNVVTPDGTAHGFAQLGAGSLVAGTHTLLSRFMLTEPEALLAEAAALEGKGVNRVLDRVSISARAPVITPFNRLLNRIQEIHRGAQRHGSCGMGIGLTQQDVEVLGDQALYVGDLQSGCVFEKLQQLHAVKIVEAERFRTVENAALIENLRNADLAFYAGLYRRFATRVRVLTDEEFTELICDEDTVFEGAQGVLLDQQFGFFPHCTRSNCTFSNAEQLLHEAGFAGSIERIGLLRGYGTRHGAGPFVTEVPGLAIAPCHNQLNPWQGAFRLGWFDAVSARYALKVVGGVDTLAITNLDRMRGLEQIKVATGYAPSEGELDSRYFDSHGELQVLRGDVTKLAERCGALDKVRPVYCLHDGFRAKGQTAYLEYLQAQLGHSITAFSESIDHRKSYR